MKHMPCSKVFSVHVTNSLKYMCKTFFRNYTEINFFLEVDFSVRHESRGICSKLKCILKLTIKMLG